jgi:hypothetical protein
MIEKIDTSFKAYFKELGCSGEVRIGSANGDLTEPADFTDWALLIRVSYRADMPLANLEGTRQSGGERTVATILYLMSLQKLTSCPFRLVDEINQVSTMQHTPCTVLALSLLTVRSPCTMHHTPCTPCTPHTMHRTPFTTPHHTTPYTIHHTPFTIHRTLYTVHHTRGWTRGTRRQCSSRS